MTKILGSKMTKYLFECRRIDIYATPPPPPPTSNTLQNKLTDSLFFEQFPDLIDTCNSLRGQICILGDMNIHYDCPDHPLTSKTLDLLYMYNFKQVVTQSTHRHGHILNCVIIRPNDQIHLSSEVTICV